MFSRWLLVCCVVVLGTGCAKYRVHKSPWLVTQGDVGRYVVKALEDPNADERRDAIVQLSKTRFADDEAVVSACALVARSDASASVRVAAIRVVAESCRAEAAGALLRVFEADAGTVAGMERVRVESLHGLCFLARNGEIAEEDRALATALGGQVLRGNTSRDMKIAAASLLGCCPRVESVRSLIGVVDDEDFGVVYEAERSLKTLTGVGHQRDALAWRMWLESTDDPLAGRGGGEGDAADEVSWWRRMLRMGG